MTVLAVPYHTDERLPDFEFPVQPDVIIDPQLPTGGPWQRMAELYDSVAVEVAKQASEGRRTLTLSGDCTTSLGIVAGLQRGGVADLGIVWFDAHGDIHTPESSASGYLGGMPLRMLLGEGERSVLERLALQPVAENQVVLTDARDLDPPEEAFLATSGVQRLRVGDLTAGGLPSGPLYLHIDVDVIDPGYLPGLLYPAPGGPALQSVVGAVRTVLETGRVWAIGLACTWHPGRAEPTGVLGGFAAELQSLLHV